MHVGFAHFLEQCAAEDTLANTKQYPLGGILKSWSAPATPVRNVPSEDSTSSIFTPSPRVQLSTPPITPPKSITTDDEKSSTASSSSLQPVYNAPVIKTPVSKKVSKVFSNALSQTDSPRTPVRNDNFEEVSNYTCDLQLSLFILSYSSSMRRSASNLHIQPLDPRFPLPPPLLSRSTLMNTSLTPLLPLIRTKQTSQVPIMIATRTPMMSPSFS